MNNIIKVSEIAKYVKNGVVRFWNGKYYYLVSSEIRRNGRMLVTKSQLDQAVKYGLLTREDIAKIPEI